MLLCHVSVELLWKTEWTCSTTWNSTVERAFMACQVFAHGLHHLELLATSSTGQFLLCWSWTMLSLQMMDQGLLCCIAKVMPYTNGSFPVHRTSHAAPTLLLMQGPSHTDRSNLFPQYGFSCAASGTLYS